MFLLVQEKLTRQIMCMEKSRRKQSGDSKAKTRTHLPTKWISFSLLILHGAAESHCGGKGGAHPSKFT